ncbi:phage holin [Lacticaseibacillus sharpeae]|uniref:Holin n=1 Tax=Lacticaseibacillus sharpeae JCM 1186 = DSM 20505 TaxID=1291052 RepID=A0A0R1ZIY4_9LACO|nr:phage holin [Lacticaseibacillus sharpeae]KRM54829.1 hypothetical protein FC18_GL002246 [Lacticaseibacillus sharpeae JCM 1186 = DSM 20505]
MINWLKKINWGVRFSDPGNMFRLVLVVGAPILTYYGLTATDLTSWGVVIGTLGKALSNPYVLGTVAVSFYGWLVDPTTANTSDSKQALTYTTPKEDK